MSSSSTIHCSTICSDVRTHSGLIVCNEIENFVNSENNYQLNVVESVSSLNLKFNFLALNVCGITSKLKYKNIQHIVSKHDFVCFSEIRTSFIAKDDFPGYDIIISDKKCKKRGFEVNKLTGLAILIKSCKEFTYERINSRKTVSEWVLWVKVCDHTNNLSFLLGATYIPCETSTFYSEDIYDYIAIDILDLKTEFQLPVILMGDFNSRSVTLSDIVTYEKEIVSTTGFNDKFY